MAASKTKLPDQRKSVKEESLDHETGLYRHVKRPEWGVAIMAWEKNGRRAYQFEDGRLRRFKEGYYSLMQPAGQVEESEALVADLQAAIEAKRGSPGKKLDPVAPFDDQIELFKHLYPEGFKDEKWIVDHRTDGRALKRHREPASRDTQEQLSKARCDELIADGRHDDLVEAALEILAGTDLVALRDVKTLRAMEEDERKEYAEILRDLLHGEADYGQRFKRYVEFLEEVLGGRPSWRLATALQALMFPDYHVCVRRSAFIRQAASIAPKAKYTKKPRRRSYANFRRVATAVQTRLEAADHEPRDLLDVYDFIWDTLRNAALEHLVDDD